MNLEETQVDQFSQVRTMANTVGRDYFGALGKRIWTLDYTNTNPTDYTTISNIRDTYRSTATTQTWQISETNYTVSSTTVHVELVRRRFSVKGVSYISDFSIVLTEA